MKLCRFQQHFFNSNFCLSLILFSFNYLIFFNCLHILFFFPFFYLGNVFKVLQSTHFFDDLFYCIKHVLMLKWSKEMVGFHLHCLFNFLNSFHVKTTSMDNAQVMKTNTSHNHIWYISQWCIQSLQYDCPPSFQNFKSHFHHHLVTTHEV